MFPPQPPPHPPEEQRGLHNLASYWAGALSEILANVRRINGTTVMDCPSHEPQWSVGRHPGRAKRVPKDREKEEEKKKKTLAAVGEWVAGVG
ncbi:hypothetical protein CEXT_684051 [Caerostris extrusa]|uniref:Histone acetyltransferase n=1 Tax=Caerostris extrusa TaxID=172846 RepID=A0AAV4VL77_CAEEX|nr:hypothetical protein CEXT_684051 [Caerostris extrusa]